MCTIKNHWPFIEFMLIDQCFRPGVIVLTDWTIEHRFLWALSRYLSCVHLYPVMHSIIVSMLIRCSIVQMCSKMCTLTLVNWEKVEGWRSRAREQHLINNDWSSSHIGLCVMFPGTAAKYFTTCFYMENTSWNWIQVGRSSLPRILF